MPISSCAQQVELLSVIVNFGVGSKVLKIAKEHGVSGGTIFLGKGTIKNRILEILDLTDIRKEIVIMLVEKTATQNVIKALDTELKLSKPNHGIAFSAPLVSFHGITSCHYQVAKESRGVEEPMYKAIYTVVDKGKAEEVIEAATSAGSRGATVINARGSGIHEKKTLFAMTIEPEKEIVLILSENKSVEAIVAAINERLKIEEPGRGIIFVQEITQTYGLY